MLDAFYNKFSYDDQERLLGAYRRPCTRNQTEYVEATRLLIAGEFPKHLMAAQHRTRRNSYWLKPTRSNPSGDDRRKEELWVIDAVKNKLNLKGLGSAINLQIPLKDVREDHLGKIDLVTVSESNWSLVEVKVGDNDESILRPVLEIATYFQVVDKQKLKKDFEEGLGKTLPGECPRKVVLPGECPRKVVLLVETKNGAPTAYTQVKGGKADMVLSLAKDLNVEVWLLDKDMCLSQHGIYPV